MGTSRDEPRWPVAASFLGIARLCLAALERFAWTRWAKVALFLISLGVYGFESIAWPLSAGRDLATYLRFYEQMWGWHALLPTAQLVRTPIPPLVTGGLLDLGGGPLAESAMAWLCAGSIVARSTAALAFGRKAAMLAAAAALGYPGARARLFAEGGPSRPLARSWMAQRRMARADPGRTSARNRHPLACAELQLGRQIVVSRKLVYKLMAEGRLQGLPALRGARCGLT